MRMMRMMKGREVKEEKVKSPRGGLRRSGLIGSLRGCLGTNMIQQGIRKFLAIVHVGWLRMEEIPRSLLCLIA